VRQPSPASLGDALTGSDAAALLSTLDWPAVTSSRTDLLRFLAAFALVAMEAHPLQGVLRLLRWLTASSPLVRGGFFFTRAQCTALGDWEAGARLLRQAAVDDIVSHLLARLLAPASAAAARPDAAVAPVALPLVAPGAPADQRRGGGGGGGPAVGGGEVAAAAAGCGGCGHRSQVRQAPRARAQLTQVRAGAARRAAPLALRVQRQRHVQAQAQAREVEQLAALAVARGEQAALLAQRAQRGVRDAADGEAQRARGCE
jgi:hypothetical protein